MGTTAIQANASALESKAVSRVATRRKLSPQSGRAIEMLGHAIEYLADEFALECMSGHRSFVGSVHPQIAAIELLKSRNREIYLSAPQAPTFGEWLRSLLRAKRA